MHESWEQLTPTLHAGKRIFATRDKDPRELQKAFSVFLGAMDEAARVRAVELWDWLPFCGIGGETILDAGAATGRFWPNF